MDLACADGAARSVKAMKALASATREPLVRGDVTYVMIFLPGRCSFL
jgi:hypothetical protein